MFDALRKVLIIAFNDLRTALKERATLINILVLPIFMTVLLGVVNTNSASGGTLDVVRADPNDVAAGRLSNLLFLNAREAFVICDLPSDACGLSAEELADPRAAAEQRVKSGKTSAALIIPAGYGADLAANKQIALPFIVQNGLNGPALIQQKIDAVLKRVNGSIAAARAVTDAMKPTDEQRPVLYTKVVNAADAIWATDPVRIIEQTSTGTTVVAGTGFGQSAPGFGAMFVLIGAVGLATVFVTERQTWTMQRMMIMPIARWQILAGKLLARYALGLITFFTLIIVGTLFGTQWGDWLGVVLTVLVYTLAAVSLALAFSTLIRTKSQAANIGFVIGMILAPLGGAWWPLSITPAWMQALGKLSIVSWSQEAFSKLVYYGGNVFDILPYLAVLLVFSAVFFAFGLRRFRYL